MTARTFTLLLSQCRTKKEYFLPTNARKSSKPRLAGIRDIIGVYPTMSVPPATFGSSSGYSGVSRDTITLKTRLKRILCRGENSSQLVIQGG